MEKTKVESRQLAFPDVTCNIWKMDYLEQACIGHKQTDRYFQYSRHHPINQKGSAAHTLFSKADKVISNKGNGLKNSIIS